MTDSPSLSSSCQLPLIPTSVSKEPHHSCPLLPQVAFDSSNSPRKRTTQMLPLSMCSLIY
uniref:Glycosyltransferase n=1 Tax=Rhizophora mucronata TaxID=61149 RepID=A0A2P2PB98_RHIMU